MGLRLLMNPDILALSFVLKERMDQSAGQISMDLMGHEVKDFKQIARVYEWGVFYDAVQERITLTVLP